MAAPGWDGAPSQCKETGGWVTWETWQVRALAMLEDWGARTNEGNSGLVHTLKGIISLGCLFFFLPIYGKWFFLLTSYSSSFSNKIQIGKYMVYQNDIMLCLVLILCHEYAGLKKNSDFLWVDQFFLELIKRQIKKCSTENVDCACQKLLQQQGSVIQDIVVDVGSRSIISLHW